MSDKSYLNNDTEMAWCPGCGNFKIRQSVDEALQSLDVERKDVVFVSGIGQAAKAPHYLNVNFFNGLHGRALPAAIGIKAANPGLTVIVESGDGDMYGEGGNHLLHAIRRNSNITVLVHNNMVYGLTKGQASPTSRRGFHTPVQVEGVTERPFNPVSTAIANNAGFVARANGGDSDETAEIIKKALQYRGLSLVDLFQTCVSFNKVNNVKWFRDHTYYLDKDYDPGNRTEAFAKSIEEDPMPLGVLYTAPERETFSDTLPVYRENKEPLFKRSFDQSVITAIIDKKMM